tara:strand:- start:21677 stop:22216 length:540 start_codon:yes stop_codon:yes gene_type:complete
MKVSETKLPGVVAIEPDIHGDELGFFFETFQQDRYARDAGIELPFVQDNQSKSAKGVLPGLHFQKTNPQGKLVRVTAGEVFDVAVDIDPASPTVGQWVGVTLNAQQHNQIYVPLGYAHGFLVLSDSADFLYNRTAFYYPVDEGGVSWEDPGIAIDWPLGELPLVSVKDQSLPLLQDLML